LTEILLAVTKKTNKLPTELVLNIIDYCRKINEDEVALIWYNVLIKNNPQDHVLMLKIIDDFIKLRLYDKARRLCHKLKEHRNDCAAKIKGKLDKILIKECDEQTNQLRSKSLTNLK
jgi:hypothetical protein